jgi:hypothetical protein
LVNRKVLLRMRILLFHIILFLLVSVSYADKGGNGNGNGKDDKDLKGNDNSGPGKASEKNPSPPPPKSKNNEQGITLLNCINGVPDPTNRFCVCIGESSQVTQTPGFCKDAAGACTIIREYVLGVGFRACNAAPAKQARAPFFSPVRIGKGKAKEIEPAIAPVPTPSSSTTQPSPSSQVSPAPPSSNLLNGMPIPDFDSIADQLMLRRNVTIDNNLPGSNNYGTSFSTSDSEVRHLCYELSVDCVMLFFSSSQDCDLMLRKCLSEGTISKEKAFELFGFHKKNGSQSSTQRSVATSTKAKFDYQLRDIKLGDFETVIVDGSSVGNRLEKTASNQNIYCYFDAITVSKKETQFPSSAYSVADGKDSNYINFAKLDEVADFFEPRVENAHSLGCTGILWGVQDVRRYANILDFRFTEQNFLDYVNTLAEITKSQDMKVGIQDVGYVVDQVKNTFDFAVSVSCDSAGSCSLFNGFRQLGKPVFDVEFGVQAMNDICRGLQGLNITGIFKDPELRGNEPPVAC